MNFGLTAAKALEEGKIDGFWANGMGTEVAVRRGVGKVVLDVRRGDGPKACFNYTMASIATSDRLINDASRCCGRTRCVRSSPRRRHCGPSLNSPPRSAQKLFPPQEAALIADLIRRDLPYYDAGISPAFVEGMNAFARDIGILSGHPRYEQVVATQFADLWKQ